MTEQFELFPDPATTIQVGASREEPALWVRRLLIWERPSDPPFRTVPFRRGLNIVWSPDPGIEDAEVGRSSGSGHGAGKTLLCRLLRYCLGEETFAPPKVKHRISKSLSEGVVGAELVLSGETWGVVRKLGNARQAVVAKHRQPEEILAAETPPTGMTPLLEAIQEALHASALEQEMPGETKWKSWFISLAWLARDQECRFDHTLSWRHKATDSKPSLLDMTNEQLLVAVRLLIKAIDIDELRLKEERGAVSERAKTLSKRKEHLEWSIERMTSELLPRLGLEPTLIESKELGDRAILRAAEEKLGVAEAELALGDEAPEVSSTRSEREAVIGEIEANKAKLEGVMADLTVLNKLVSFNEPESTSTEDEDAPKTCMFCGAPLDREPETSPSNVINLFAAMQESDVEPEIAEMLHSSCSACAKNDRIEIHRLRRKLTELKASRDRLSREIDKRKAEAKARLNKSLQRYQEADRAESAAARLEALRADLGELNRRLDELEKQKGKLKEAIAKARTQHRAVIDRFEELFRYVCRGLLGTGTDASLTLDAKGLQTSVEVGGAAMDSVQAIAFDVAAMLMSMEGRTHLPAFLVHDSPRATDLGISVYHRLLRFGAALEADLKGPPFQYILTTTTEPPEELQEEFVVTELSGFMREERLLGRSI